MLDHFISQIRPADAGVYAACIKHFDEIAKPIGCLGHMENALAKIAAIQADPEIDLGKRCALVLFSDNGVVAQAVSQSQHDVTTAVARLFAQKRSCLSAFARVAHADIFPVDVGMIDTVPGLLAKKIARATQDFSKEPAMSPEEMEAALTVGFERVAALKADGYRLVALGEVGIGNTTSSSAIASVLLNLPPAAVTGMGAGLPPKGLERKIAVISTALALHKVEADRPLDVLQKLGGFDIAAMVGAYLGGAYYRVPMVIDGLIASVAALLAQKICPLTLDYMLASHVSAEPAARLLLDALGLPALITADLRLGEGSGALALFPLLDMAAELYTHGTTFAEAALENYERYGC